MTALALACAAVLSVMLAVSLFNLWTAPRLERAGEPDATPKVSLLMPARDEAENLRRTLPSLLAQDYPALEILLLDDRSTDGTGDVARRIASDVGGRLTVLQGAEPPAGWVGKNWACHQLAKVATGEILVFCDADVEAAPAAVRRTVAMLRRHAAGALTALPRQRLEGWAQAAVVPVVAQLPVLALLPMRLIPVVRAPSLSMANGQWLAFTRAAYDACGGHAAVRGEVLEDVALGRRIKAAGHRLVACVAPALLAVRMYGSAREMREGFRKNLYPLLGGRRLSFAFGVALLAFAWLAPFAIALIGRTRIAFLPLALLLVMRVAGALLFRYGWRTVLLHPVGVLMAAALAVESWIRHERGTVTWRGRRVPSGADGAAADGAGGRGVMGAG
ncbi:glycosyltransferase [Longimicrobium sp.]|uniref:glycosyltransferase n=1 Tax=Longimicrobium sp. TaxID=2029185 RepID=UPI002E325F18|nr:glycosyltransferase [Longimicrobium sp.]HEX6036585.1 glycosyltransferase [Longimicrobium sp.]